MNLLIVQEVDEDQTIMQLYVNGVQANVLKMVICRRVER